MSDITEQPITDIETRINNSAGGVDYEMQFTRNPELIAGYKQLRKDLYDIDPRFVGFRIFNETSAENYEDLDDQMLILHSSDKIYGGACLRISTPQHPVILDLEQDIKPDEGKFYFSLRERFPEWEMDKYAYAEFNRIVLDPCLRKGEATRQMFKAVLERCLAYKVRYMFGIGDKIRTRLYRQIYINAGVQGGVRTDVDIPMREDYEGTKMYLLNGDMKCFYVTPDDPDAKCMLEPRNDFEFH